MSIKHWFSQFLIISILIGLCLGSFSPSVNAQDISTSQPTDTPEIQSTETPTNEPPTAEPPPTETSVPADTPTETATVSPPATETPTPENSPTSDLTPSEIQTETATADLTTTVTPTETETPTLTPTITPTETAAEENWRVEYDLNYSSAGLRDLLSLLDDEQEVTYNLDSDTEGGGSLIKLAVEGNGGVEQFRHIYLDILAPAFGTISRVSQIWIASSGNSISEWQLALDSNITTGYSWQLVEASGIAVSSESFLDSASGGIGGVGRQYFYLENDGSGSNSISFKYSSPRNASASPAHRIYLNISIP